MAKLVKNSIYTVTWELGLPGAIVLLAPGMSMEDELQGLDPQQNVEDGDYIEAEESEPLAMGNTKRTLSFTTIRTHASAVAARNYCFSHDAAIPENVQGTITVAISGGDTWVLSQCVPRSWPTTPDRTNMLRTITRYEFKCGKLTLGTPSGPDPVGLDDSAVSLRRTVGPMLNGSGATAAWREAIASWTNAGTRGDFLQATAGSRPLEMEGPALYLPGTAGNYFGISTTNAAATFRVQWAGYVADYTPAARVCLMSKWDDASLNQRSWALYLEPSGQVTLAVSADGTAGTVTEWTSALPLGLANGSFVALGVERGAVSITWSIYPDLNWTTAIAFSPATTAATVDPFNNSENLMVGSTGLGTAHRGEMRVLQVRYTADLNGPPTTIMDFSGSGLTWSAGTIVQAFTGVNPLAWMTNTRVYSARFDGTDDSLALATPMPVNGLAGLSLFLYAKPNVTAGTQDLLFMGTAGTDPRVMLRLNGTNVELHVRRLDADAVTILSAAYITGGIFNQFSASIDFANGTATLYVNKAPRDIDSLASAGPSQASNSSETRLGAGQGGANPAAVDLGYLHVIERATNPFEHIDIWTALEGANP